MKRLILTILLSATIATIKAQSPVTVSLGGGISTTPASLKTEAFLGDGYQIQTQVFIPLLRKGWDGSVKGSGKFALGILAGGDYATAKTLTTDVDDLKSTYRLYNDALNVTSTQHGAAQSYSGFAGLQADITFGVITFSPSLSGGYFSLSQKGFTQSSEVTSNGTTENITLRALSPTQQSGFITKPQLKIGYALSQQFSIYAAGAINMGPVLTTEQSYLKPAGGFNEKSTYESVQLTTGKMVTKTSETRYQTANVNIGISWSFGSSKRLRGKVTKPGDNGMIMQEEQPAGKSISEKGVSSTKSRRNENSIAVVDNPEGQPAGKSIREKGVSSTKSRRNENTVVVPDNPEDQPAGKSISTKGVSSTKDKNKAAITDGNPIGGIIVKGGKNPGGNMLTVVTNDKGELVLNHLEAGNYVFTITAPAQPAGKSISEKGLSSTKGRRTSTAAFTAGSPIGGIVVKGGKNPGGNLLVITTNSNGTFSFTASEAGDYLFTVLQP